jgi:chaperonin GroEL (HSP60 family)
MIEVLKQALEALESMKETLAEHDEQTTFNEDEAIKSLRQAIAEFESQEPVQVSPLEFVEMVMEKEHLIGKPIFWAEWPNQEKNT